MNMKKILLFSIAVLALAVQSCTKVNENNYDKPTPTAIYSSPQGANVLLAAVYRQITGDWSNNYAGRDNCWYDLNSYTCDDQIIPHRNTGDWGTDQVELYTHTEPTSLGIISNTWTWAYEVIGKANTAITTLTASKGDPASIAEVKVARAWAYYLLMDDFGSVPFYTDNNTPVNKIPQISRKDLYTWIVTELKANVDLLSTTKGGAYYGRFNKWAGYMVLAKVYLNAGVYTGTADWQDALDAANVVASGGFTLHPATANPGSPNGNTYYELFGDVCPDDETILAITLTEGVISGNIYAIRGLNNANGNAIFTAAGAAGLINGWNGTVVPATFYNKYDNADIRKKQFLVGAVAGGTTYTTTLSSLISPGAGPDEGIRDLKFVPVLPVDASGASNDFPVYRYADVLLMQAECEVRLGNAAAAKPFIDQVRVRAGIGALAAAPTLTDIYDERGRELVFEGHRRQDMIRFGTYLLPKEYSPATQPATEELFPIPSSILANNPLLKQNPGYN
jgi:hypothetical protein